MRRKGNVPVGQGRVSKSLGANDPRLYRNAQAAQASHLNLGTGVERDALGRLRVTPARRVDKLGEGADPFQIVIAYNKLVDELRTSGALEDGRR
jgi:hypothetical protein